jgi:outer membrane protein
MAALVAMMLAVAAPKLYAQVRLAVVDMQRAILETEEGRRAKNQLKKLFESRQEQLNDRQESLKRLKADLEKQERVLSRDALQKRMSEYQEQLVSLQKNYMEYQQELAQREAALTKEILVNLQGVVRQIGTAEGYTAIFDQSGIVWAPTHIDLTDRVIAEFNRAHPPGSEAAPAAEGDAGTRPARPAARPAAGGANPHPRGAQP